MGRRTNSSDILNGRTVALDPDRGKNNLAPYTATAIPTSLTLTATLMGLTGPGIVHLVQLTHAAGDQVRLRINIDGTDLSLSTSAGQGVYPVIGCAYAVGTSSAVLLYEQVPFSENFTVLASKATGTVTNGTFTTAYRLVEL